MSQTPPAPSFTAGELRIRARDMLRVRKAAKSYFGRSVLSEPAWNILLTLIASAGATRGLHITSVAERALIPRSTALRCLLKLERHGFVKLVPDKSDKRAVRVELTTHGHETVRKSFVAAQFLPK